MITIKNKNIQMKKQTITTCLLIVLLLSKLHAQFSIGVNSGIGGLWYKTVNTSVKLKPSIGAEMGFTHMFSKHWGFVTGIGASQYATDAAITNSSTMIASQTDDVGAAFEYRVKSAGYKESQRLISIHIPAMVQYRSLGNNTQWYFNGGAKFFIPFDVKVKTEAQQLDLSGYYPDVNLEIQDLAQHGFGTVYNWKDNRNYTLKPGVAATASTGVSFKLPNNCRFEVGIYADYVLNNMKKNTGMSLVSYNAPLNSGVVSNSVLAVNNTGSIKLFSAGLQLKYGFNLKKTDKPVVQIKDMDKDGVPDNEDECPCVAGPLCTKGCPDTDGDGIPDKDDKCPNVKGLARYSGCPIPDTDNDGINDEEDKCPLVKGLAIYQGCPPPDRDHDGIPDDEDKCPDVPGVASHQGCPIPDTDKDGVNDEEDLCPNTPGPIQNHGCPIIEQEVIKKVNFAANNILFKTGTATLEKSSFKGLNDVAQIMKVNAGIRLKIDGHTDIVGSDSFNVVLSQDRANAVFQYLVTKGIDAGHMKVTGYGKTLPVASNNTPDGRQQNRRVELKLLYD